jgi:hypothetical protein
MRTCCSPGTRGPIGPRGPPGTSGPPGPLGEAGEATGGQRRRAALFLQRRPCAHSSSNLTSELMLAWNGLIGAGEHVFYLAQCGPAVAQWRTQRAFGCRRRDLMPARAGRRAGWCTRAAGAAGTAGAGRADGAKR